MIPDPNPTLGTTWPLWPAQLGLGFLETLETLETLVKIIEPAGCKGQVVSRVGLGSGIIKKRKKIIKKIKN